MAKTKVFNEDEVKSLRQDLAKLPAKKVINAEELIFSLLDELEKAKANGYSDVELIGLLAKRGAELTENSFKVYLRKARARKKAEGEGKK